MKKKIKKVQWVERCLPEEVIVDLAVLSLQVSPYLPDLIFIPIS